MSKISIWYFFIHDELLENCYEKIVIKDFIQNKVDIVLYRASRIPGLPGPRFIKSFFSDKMVFERQNGFSATKIWLMGFSVKIRVS